MVHSNRAMRRPPHAPLTSEANPPTPPLSLQIWEDEGGNVAVNANGSVAGENQPRSQSRCPEGTPEAAAHPEKDGATAEQWVAPVSDLLVEAEAKLRAAEEALFAERERAQVALDAIGDAVLMTDARGRVTYLNSVAATMTGWPNGEALGHSLTAVFNLVDGLTGEVAVSPAISAMLDDRAIDLVDHCVLFRRDGSGIGIEHTAAPVHDHNGRVSGAVIVFRDVSHSRNMIRKMAYLARHDALTGLANRSLLTERLSHAINLAQRHGKRVALLFLDLDGFKKINDSLGHTIGDQVLRAIAGRLADGVRVSDTVCRLGGDEFVIVLAEIDQPRDASLIAEKLLAALTAPLRINGHTLQVSASVGISLHPDDSVDVQGMIDHADTAMYHAKVGEHDGYSRLRATLNGRAGPWHPS